MVIDLNLILLMNYIERVVFLFVQIVDTQMV